MSAPSRPLTLADALGSMSRPLARLLAQWSKGPAWRRRIVRAVYPDVARAIDELAAALESKIGPL